jgi:ABC-2 type transport system ATP-binding protein
MNPALLLELRDVTRHFGRGRRRVTALSGVALDVVAGEIVGLVGANGAGKTTLLRIAAGQLAPHAGTVVVAGYAPRVVAARRVLGFAPAAPLFPPALTVRELLEYCARLHARPAPARRALVAEAVALGGLEDVLRRRATELSTGYLQRLALAQAAIGARRIVLLDESLAGSDPVARRAICERLAALAARGVAIVLSSHDLAAVERLAGRVIILRAGRVVRAAPTVALLRERVLEIVLDGPPATLPPGFRRTPAGVEVELGDGSVEGVLALCRAHRLAVRASRVRLKTLEDVVVDESLR